MLPRSFLRLVPPKSFRVPLRIALVVPFVLQISAAVALTGYLGLKNGQRAVNEVAAQLVDEVTLRVHQHVTDYMQTPELVTQINADAADLGEIDLQAAQSLERRFWKQMQRFKFLNPIAFGTEQGTIHSVDRLADGSLVIRVTDRSTGGKYHTYTIDAQGNRDQLLQVNTTFDPRTRPWYIDAVKARKLTWTKIYPYFSSSGLAISATQPFYDKTGTLLGVTNATLSLSQLSKFLHHIQIGRTGQTFIIERSANLVASSTAEEPFRLNYEGNEERERLAATSSSNSVTRLATQHLIQHFGNLEKINHNQQLTFTIAGKQQFLQVTPFADRNGLDWLIVVVLPEADFMEHIEANTRLTILMCLGALVLAMIVGVITSRWIAQPISQLNLASKALAQGQRNQRVKVRGIRELETLAQAHNQMAAELQRSFIALEQANADLEHRVEERTAELVSSQSQMQAILDYTPVILYIIDTKGQMLFANAEWYRVFGQVLGNPIVGRNIADLLSSEDAASFFRENQSFLSASSAMTFENDMELPDGMHTFLRVKFPLQGSNGEIYAFCGAALDITERKQSEEQLQALTQQLQQQNEQLEEVSRLKSEFLTNMSHELRTPLTSILGFSSVLLKQHFGPLTAKQEQYLSLVRSSGEHLLSLINDLLDLAKIEAGKLELSKEPVDVAELCQEAIQMVEVRAVAKQQHLSLVLPIAVQSIVGDRQRVLQILLNYLSNAIKFTPEGGTIMLSSRLETGLALEALPSVTHASPAYDSEAIFLVLEVSDTGLGIAPEKQHLLFQTFQQIDGAHDRLYEGTGLGLALTRRLAELHKGAVSCTSTPDGGSKFSVWLPLGSHSH